MKVATMIEEKHLQSMRDVLNLSASQREPFRRYTILSMQLANVGKCIEYMKAYPSLEKEYKAELKADLSDLLVQTIIMIILYGLDPKELLELGVERLAEFRRKGPFVE